MIILGGVVAVLIILVLSMAVIVVLLKNCQRRRRKLKIREKERRDNIQMNENLSYEERSTRGVQHTVPCPAYGFVGR